MALSTIGVNSAILLSEGLLMTQTAKILTAYLSGLEAVPATVTATIEPGSPYFDISLASNRVDEVRAKVRTAIRTSGFTLPKAGITVSVTPDCAASMVEGCELPIALAVLCASGQVDQRLYEDKLVCGNFEMGEYVAGVRGSLAYQKLAAERQRLFVGAMQPFTEFDGIMLSSLRWANEPAERKRVEARRAAEPPSFLMRYGDVDAGMPLTKLAVMVAAVGHHPLLIGREVPSGYPIALLLRALLPEMDGREQREVDLVYSASLEGPREGRPLRMPHHTISGAGLLGGGRQVMPGEVSLASHGVLCLENVDEFGQTSLRQLRIALDEGLVRIARVSGIRQLPAKTDLVMTTSDLKRVAPAACELADVVVDADIDVFNEEPELEALAALDEETMRQLVDKGVAFRRSGVRSEARITDFDDKELGVARTLADLDQSVEVNREHLLAAHALVRPPASARMVATMTEGLGFIRGEIAREQHRGRRR